MRRSDTFPYSRHSIADMFRASGSISALFRSEPSMLLGISSHLGFGRHRCVDRQTSMSMYVMWLHVDVIDDDSCTTQESTEYRSIPETQYDPISLHRMGRKYRTCLFGTEKAMQATCSMFIFRTVGSAGIPITLHGNNHPGTITDNIAEAIILDVGVHTNFRHYRSERRRS